MERDGYAFDVDVQYGKTIVVLSPLQSYWSKHVEFQVVVSNETIGKN
jgi:hypothetical protein